MRFTRTLATVGASVAALGLGLLAPVCAGAATQTGAAPHVSASHTIVAIAHPATPAQLAQAGLMAAASGGHGCNGGEASNNSYVHVCFKRYGDVIFVRDDEANGRSAVGAIQFYDAGSWYTRGCRHTHSHASGIWAYCKFSRTHEHTTAYYWGYDQKGTNADTAQHFTGTQAESTS